MSNQITCVWFKKDLRVNDHAPLFDAAQRGYVIPIYIIEPDILCSKDFSSIHWQFISDSLIELKKKLCNLGQPLIIRQGEAIDVFKSLLKETNFNKIYSHQETGNNLSYIRDKNIRNWCKSNSIEWTEFSQNGVLRGLKKRDGWSAIWEKRMREKIIEIPRIKPFIKKINSQNIPSADDLNLKKSASNLLKGGSSEAYKWIDSFLEYRGNKYYKEMSSPNTAYDSCSRISPYLAHGCISMKEVVKKVKSNQNLILKSSTRSFLARCHWHCHFMQKLESEPEIEFKCFHPSFESLRMNYNKNYLNAWKNGETGFPFIDACMRSLKANGWINFRMRAMLVSFAANNLWIDWRDFKNFLACNFIDYEPGIHYSQIQMQSGVTGINTLRIYNPLKQGYDHDINGNFIKKWVPELTALDGKDLHEPWSIPDLISLSKGFKLGRDYPEPIINLKNSVNHARESFKKVRTTPNFRELSNEVFKKHGSRKKSSRKQNS